MIAGLQRSAAGGPLVSKGLTLCLINPSAFQERAGFCVCVCQSGKCVKGQPAFPPPFRADVGRVAFGPRPFTGRRLWNTGGDVSRGVSKVYGHKRHYSL